jgi:hypothetical protein
MKIPNSESEHVQLSTAPEKVSEESHQVKIEATFTLKTPLESPQTLLKRPN